MSLLLRDGGFLRSSQPVDAAISCSSLPLFAVSIEGLTNHVAAARQMAPRRQHEQERQLQ